MSAASETGWERREIAFMVLSVVVVALMVATLAIFLYAVGVFFNRTSDDLEDCV